MCLSTMEGDLCEHEILETCVSAVSHLSEMAEEKITTVDPTLVNEELNQHNIPDQYTNLIYQHNPHTNQQSAHQSTVSIPINSQHTNQHYQHKLTVNQHNLHSRSPQDPSQVTLIKILYVPSSLYSLDWTTGLDYWTDLCPLNLSTPVQSRILDEYFFFSYSVLLLLLYCCFFFLPKKRGGGGRWGSLFIKILIIMHAVFILSAWFYLP